MKTIQLTPSCKDYLWGGEKLRTEYGIQSNLHPRVNNALTNSRIVRTVREFVLL